MFFDKTFFKSLLYMYLIHIKDILKNTEYIYNTGTIDFKSCIDYLKEQLEPERQENLKYTINDNYSEVYYDYNFQNRGWIWTTEEVRKDIIYILTKIPVLNKSKIDNSTQTIKSTNHLTVEVQTPVSIKDNILISSLTQTEDNLDNVENVIETISDPNWPFYTETLQEIKPISHYAYGYAKNPFAPLPQWPDEITTELKKKLTIPNFGLKSIYSSNLDYSDYL